MNKKTDNIQDANPHLEIYRGYKLQCVRRAQKLKKEKKTKEKVITK